MCVSLCGNSIVMPKSVIVDLFLLIPVDEYTQDIPSLNHNLCTYFNRVSTINYITFPLWNTLVHELNNQTLWIFQSSLRNEWRWCDPCAPAR